MNMALKSKASILKLMGDRIKSERLLQNLTQTQLSDRSGVAYSTLRKIESSGEGAMKDYVNILFALGKIDQLENFLPEPTVNPEAVFKARGKVRERARGTR